jgi:hypothetical protein
MRGGFLKVAGVVLIVLGLMTAVRGADWMHAMHSGMDHGTMDHGTMDHGTMDMPVADTPAN